VVSQSAPSEPAPGAAPGRKRRQVDWELISCAFQGHALVGVDAAEVGPGDHALVREGNGLRWHRCLRCDAWLPLTAPEEPARRTVPSLDEVAIPLRGRPLRDRYVLRLIAVERAFHVLVFALLAIAIFLFIPHRDQLHSDYTRFLQDVRNGVVGPGAGRGGFWTLINRVFAISKEDLILIGIALVLYCVLLSVEIVGLWRARRWAEYLTFIESCVLLPYEIYELTKSVTVLKVVGLVANLAILLYLAIVHRLFGIRGGSRATRAAYEAHGGRRAFDRATPRPSSSPEPAGVSSPAVSGAESGPAAAAAVPVTRPGPAPPQAG
jgi:uncharacterized membrane protein (DUF2068 family)